MEQPIRSAEAVVVLPAPIDGFVSDKRVRRWLARADLEMCAAPQEILSRVVSAIGQPECTDGLAALRFWGHTGDRPKVWMAAADPVHLEVRLDHLRLHRLSPDEYKEQELRDLFDELQAGLAQDDRIGFVPIGSCGYLRGDSAMPTALFSPEVVNGCDPSDFLPIGPDAAHYQTLFSEIQMTLHNSTVNRRREEQGLRAINSLWVWGGGTLSKALDRDIPPLFADDKMLIGYWQSASGEVHPWRDSLEHCISQAPHGFVAVMPDRHASNAERAATLTTNLRDLRQFLKNSGLRALTLLFRHGLTACIRPRQIFRIWRRDVPHFLKPATE